MFTSLSRLWNAADALARSLTGLSRTVDDVNGRLRLSLGLDAEAADGPPVLEHKGGETPTAEADAPKAKNGRAKQPA